MANNSIGLTGRYDMNTEEFSAWIKYRIIRPAMVAAQLPSGGDIRRYR
jgi:hypothetical protein